MLSFDDLHENMEKLYEGAPHRLAGIKLALADAEGALATLANFGHHFALCEATPPSAEWPKMFYDADGKQLVVQSPEMAAMLTEGWSDTPPGAEPKAKVEPIRVISPEPVMLSLSESGPTLVLGEQTVSIEPTQQEG